MEYSDNPRKIYGKVEIVYSDADISKDLETTESGNSEISHPQEIYRGYATPTVRACTMDGNCTMDGSWFMIDDSCKCGWWSGSLSDGNGVFATPPFIELAFVQRPIISWKIKGDSKLEQYPVDFRIDYKRNGTIVRSENIVGNDLLEVLLTPKIEDITSVRMTITKWSKGNACAKIMQFYETLFETYEGDAMQMFEVNEELGAADGNYNINSDTMTVSIYNEERKFDKGYLRSLTVLDRKVMPYLGIEKDGKIEYTALGTFYSDEWQVSQDSQWVKCNAVDKLMRLQTKTYVGFPLTNNATMYEITEDILQKGGLTPSQYIISEELKNMVVPMAFIPKISVWDALQEIANAGLCKIYMDRQDRTIVRAESEVSIEETVRISPSNMFTYTSNITLTEFANSVNVEYCEITLSDDLVDTAEIEVVLNPYESKVVECDYTSDIAYASAVSDNAKVRISNFTSGVNAGTMTVSNTSGEYATAIITISGNAIEVNSKKINKQDAESVDNFGVIEYTHPASELVQSSEHAVYIANILLGKMKANQGNITTTWRGNPALQLGDRYECEDRFGDTNKLICEYNKFSFDGGLKQETRGRKV